MKRTIISTISVVVLSTVLSGCMDKLEILPNDQIITENFFEEGSPEEIESGVNSMYQRLQSSYMYNLRMWTLDIVAGEGRVGNEAGGNGLETTRCLTSQRPAITPGLRNYGADPGRESVERIGF